MYIEAYCCHACRVDGDTKLGTGCDRVCPASGAAGEPPSRCHVMCRVLRAGTGSVSGDIHGQRQGQCGNTYG